MAERSGLGMRRPPWQTDPQIIDRGGWACDVSMDKIKNDFWRMKTFFGLLRGEHVASYVMFVFHVICRLE